MSDSIFKAPAYERKLILFLIKCFIKTKQKWYGARFNKYEGIRLISYNPFCKFYTTITNSGNKYKFAAPKHRKSYLTSFRGALYLYRIDHQDITYFKCIPQQNT